MKPENIFSTLSALRQEGRLRQVQDLRMETASLGVDREGKRYIVFNSNDYLGMTHAKEVQEAAQKDNRDAKKDYDIIIDTVVEDYDKEMEELINESN